MFAQDPVPAAPEPKPHGWRAVNIYLLTAAAFMVVVAGLHAAASIIVPFLLALFIAVICAPVYQAMTRRRVPASIAILGIVLMMLGAVLLMVGVLERAINSISGRLPHYQAALFAQVEQLWRWLEAYGLEVPDVTLREYFDPQSLIHHLGTVASALGDVLTTTFIIVIVAIFILLEGSALPDKIRQVDGLSFETWTRLRQIVAHVRRYMFLKTVMSLLTGVLVALWLFAVGVEFPILLGVLAFALNYIPTIGSIVAAIPCILLAFIQFGLGAGRAHHARQHRDQPRRQQRHRAPLSRARAGTVAARGHSVGAVLGLGARRHGHAAGGAADHDREDRAGEQRRHALDRRAHEHAAAAPGASGGRAGRQATRPDR